MSCELPDFYRGDTYRVKIELTYTSGAAIDVTGWTFTMTLKKDLADATPDLQVQSQADGPLDDAVGGIVWLTLESTDTADLEIWNYHVDIQRSIPGSPPDVKTLLKQRVKVLANVTT